jgi:hypothetical protein
VPAIVRGQAGGELPERHERSSAPLACPAAEKKKATLRSLFSLILAETVGAVICS